MAVAVEYHTPRRRYRQESNALILGNLTVILTANKLQVVKPDPQDQQQENDEDLDNPESAAKVLCAVFEFHKTEVRILESVVGSQ